VEAGSKLQWSVQYKSQQIITPSGISLLLNDAVLGNDAVIISATEKKSKRHNQGQQL